MTDYELMVTELNIKGNENMKKALSIIICNLIDSDKELTRTEFNIEVRSIFKVKFPYLYN